MWVFLVTEVMFFGGMFLAYFVYRQAYPAAFASASNKTILLIGAANTTVLICSSLTMALAVHSAALGKKNLIVLFLILTLLLGGTFLGVKAYEYHDKWVHHEVPGHNFDCEGCTDAAHTPLFFALYFGMTGLHATHMIVGVGIILFLIAQAQEGRVRPGMAYASGVVRALLALCRYRLDLPVPVVLSDRPVGSAQVERKDLYGKSRWSTRMSITSYPSGSTSPYFSR